MSTKTIQSNYSNYSKASTCLDLYLKNPFQLAQEKSIKSVQQIFQENILEYQKSQSNFFTKVHKTILSTKKQILIFISETFFKLKKQALSQFLPLLLILTKSFKQLLKESILTFVLQLDELYKKTEDQIVKELIQKTKTTSSPLLRHYFIYKQFLRFEYSQLYKQNINSEKKKVIGTQKTIKSCISSKSSSRKIQSSTKNLIFEVQIQKIEKKFEKFSIKQLMNAYLEKQCQQMDKIQEVCRICSQKIPIQQLKKHVNFCNKRIKFKQRSIEVVGQIQKILNQMKPRHFQLELNTQGKTQKQEKLLEIFKMIYKNTSRGQGPRRSSIFSVNKNFMLPDQVKNKINSYLLDEQDKKLQDFLDLHYEKQSIDQAIDNLEKGYQYQKNKLSVDHQIYSEDSLKSLKKFCDTKSIVKSKFAQRHSDKQNNQFFQQKNIVNNSQCKISSISSIQSAKQEKVSQVHLSHKSIDQLRCSKLSKKSKNSRKSRIQFIERTSTKKNSSFIPGNMSISRASRIRLRKSPTLISKGSIQYEQYDVLGSRKCLSDEIQVNSKYKEESEAKISIKDFQILIFLGKGAFGTVYLARRFKTKDIYAIKAINIKSQWGEQEYKSIKNQHQIFKKIDGIYVVKAHFSFRQGMAHFFVMEFMPGGDLGELLKTETYLNEDISKFYIAEIILAIQHLHKAGIIHRDLKPQNLCIDEQGHLKLTDFGLSQIQIQDKLSLVKELGKTQFHSLNSTSNNKVKRAKTLKKGVVQKSQIKLIGTPDYIAPQIINKTSTNNDTIDWWSLGVMIYQILVGVRPFCGQTIQQVIDNILQFKIQWPQIGTLDGMSYQAQDLISRLIDKDFNSRLGSKGAQQIMNHPFFKGVNWENIKYQNPPFPPKIKVSYSQIEDLQQDQQLRRQIQETIGVDKKSQADQDKNNLKLQNFVRYDLLGQETIQKAEKYIENKGCQLKRLASLAKNMNQNQKNKRTRKRSKQLTASICSQNTKSEKNKQNFNIIINYKDKNI